MLLTLGLWTPATGVAADTVADEHLFVQMINELRSSRGLNPLVIDAELRNQARAWAQQMAKDDALKHSGDMSVGVTAEWDVLGENVGVHSIHDLDAIFRAFVDSPAHYDNLTDPRFDYVGVGVVHTEAGKVWTTHRFMSVRESVTPPAGTPPAPPPTAAPTTPVPTTAAPPTAVPTTAVQPTTAPPATARRAAAPPRAIPPITAVQDTTASATVPSAAAPATTSPTTTAAGIGVTALPTTDDPAAVRPITTLGAIDAGLVPADSASPPGPDVGRLAQIITQVADAGI